MSDQLKKSKESGGGAPVIRKRRKLSYERKKQIYGYGFISLWILGFITFFIRPIYGVIRYSFSRIVFEDFGYSLENVGITHYYRLFTENADYKKNLVSSITWIFTNVPLIIIISLVIAVILNQKFKGRTVARAIFFVPVIVASGMVIVIMKGDVMSQVILSGNKNSAMLQVTGIQATLAEFGMSAELIESLTKAANSLFDLLWKSGIQILLFLAALQTIPPTVFEASSIEGATGWDNFWKITIPMVSPMIILAVIYTIIDGFTDYTNPLMSQIFTQARNGSIEYSCAMSLVYFVIIVIVIGILYKIINRFVFYSVD